MKKIELTTEEKLRILTNRIHEYIQRIEEEDLKREGLDTLYILKNILKSIEQD